MRSAVLVLILVALVSLGCIIGAQPKPAENLSVQPSCADSDGGITPLTYGSVVIGTQISRDTCDSDTALREYYCDGNRLGVKAMACEAGMICSGGACVQKPAEPIVNETQPEPEAEALCSDTDEGQDFATAGSVTYNATVYEDKCQGNNDVLEYFCSNDTVASATHHCDVGDLCKSGACAAQQRECRDLDALNQSAAGTTTLLGGGVVISTKSDSCLNASTYIEYDCDGLEIVNAPVDCPEGRTCQGGTCVPPCMSVNTSSGPGVSKNGTIYTNRCKDDNTTLVRYSCVGGSVKEEKYGCPDYCYNGACLSSSDITCRKITTGVQLRYDSHTIDAWMNTCTDAETVKTYICDGNDVVSSYKACSSHQLCDAGSCEDITAPSCVPLTREDAPEAVILTDNDSVTDVNEDTCFNDITVAHYYCDEADSKTNYVSCEDDERCEDGQCIYPYTCEETAQRSSSSPAEVTLYDGGSAVRTETDLCFDASAAKQVSCSDEGRIEYTLYECPAGTACDSEIGVCR